MRFVGRIRFIILKLVVFVRNLFLSVLKRKTCDCSFFAKKVMSHFFVNKHHRKWSKLIRKYRRLCILAPRGHGKTYFFSFAYPIWRAWTQPGSIGCIFIVTRFKSKSVMEAIANEMETNVKLKGLSVMIKHSNCLQFSNNSKIYVRKFGDNITGMCFDWVVVDNDCIIEDFDKQAKQKQIDYFLTMVNERVEPSGSLIVCESPTWGRGLGWLLQSSDQYHFARYPAIGKNGKALWPERYSIEHLLNIRNKIGGARFARDYMCKLVDDSSPVRRRETA